MLKSSQLTRTTVIAATVMSLGAGPAIARPSDVPLRPTPAATATAADTPQWTQPRVEGPGVRPAGVQVTTAQAPAVPLTHASTTSTSTGGTDWLLISIIASALAALVLSAVAFARTGRPWAHPFHARHV